MQPDNFEHSVCGCAPDADSEICGDGIDNECNGRIDDCQTCGDDLVPSDDEANCGGCGIACDPTQICALGQCRCPLDKAFVCDGKCADLDSDPQHCGSCDVACASGQVCQTGACTCEDPTRSLCSGVGCVDLYSDSSNCGSCGKTCPGELTCNQGSCECPSVANPDYCEGKGCVDLQSDPTNCGSCGVECPTGATCTSGQCLCTTAKWDVCSDTCVDLGSDPQNCGTCGNVCPSAQSCVNGVCACASAGTLCDGACVNINGDSKNCGACGNVCQGLKQCWAGTCLCPISSAPWECNGVCVNLQSDASNCGACGSACPSTQVCKSGVCACASANLTVCGANCVDVKTDPLNCGACGTACAATQSCVSGACKCPTGQTWCAQAGACFNLSNDAQNCGTCGKICNPGESCAVGACGCAIGGQKWCASTGTCTDTWSNSLHCGACDNVCPAQTHCSFGSCVCDTTGYTLCNNQCFDLQNDPKHCGSCAKSCPGTMTCSAATCGCPAPLVGTAIRLTNTVSHTLTPVSAWSGAYVGVAYLEDTGNGSPSAANLYFALLNPDGTRAKSPDLALTSVPAGKTVGAYPDIVWNGSEFAVLWREGSMFGNAEAMFRRLAADGTPKGATANLWATTPGTKLPTSVPPRITWSATYGGYAVVGGGSELGFQRIGVDGTAPEPVNTVSGVWTSYRPAMAVSPTGEWAVAHQAWTPASLAFFNPDGSKTKPIVDLSTSGGATNGIDLLHDGTTWLTAFKQYSSIYVNRGASANSPWIAASIGTGAVQIDLELAGAVLDMSWLDVNLIKLKRFVLPATGSSTLTLLGSELSILGTPNALSMSAARTTSGLLEVWSDNRWGAAELYAAPVNLQGCP